MPLPIDTLLPEILDHLRHSNTLVLEAPPGAGKTTRVPPALLQLTDREVLVLEPRRLAARLAARFVAGEIGERVGETVGYQVRFEEVAGPRTRLRFLTEGVFTRRMLSDPQLEHAGAVVLDEFHERHLEGDIALALLRRLQRGKRPDLRIVVMSATLDTAPVAEFLGARVIRSEGRQHPLEIRYTPHSAAPLEQLVANVLERGLDGHVLVFLPGAAEIRRAQAACGNVARRKGCLLLPLYGSQAAEEQDRAIAPSDRPKIILSTNVAESSITIDGIGAVIDSGLARVARHSPWSGLPELQVSRVSQASANQRAGRAGRTGPGVAVRLYPLEDFVRRPAYDAPEITRADLAPAALLLGALGIANLRKLEWLDSPPEAAIDHAETLLRDLGASGETGRGMARYPLHPRLSRLIVESRRRGVAEDGCTVAALLSAGERMPSAPPHATRSDLLALMETDWEPRTVQTVRQIRRVVNPPRQRGKDEDALLISILTAFPDRVARRRQGSELQLASGGPAQLAASSTVTEAPFVVVVEAEDRSEQKSPLVRIASAVEPEWLLDLFPDRVREVTRVEWNRAAERVEGNSALLFDQIAIQESRGDPDPGAAAALLVSKALESGPARFAEMDQIDAWLRRAEFASRHAAVSPPDPHAAERGLETLAVGRKSFSELEGAAHGGGLLREIQDQMPAADRRLIDEIAPERIRLPRGRQVRVHYERDQPPWIESRIQDFFGMASTPTVARGAVPVAVRLLAPSQRPVQTTSDLAGFWRRLYPELRKELARKYPRHLWPIDPSK